jgi:leucyl aminopeptidase
MPIQESYWASCGMKSDFADMKNTGSRGGGAITAALFLKQYIEKKVGLYKLNPAVPYLEISWFPTLETLRVKE